MFFRMCRNPVQRYSSSIYELAYCGLVDGIGYVRMWDSCMGGYSFLWFRCGKTG